MTSVKLALYALREIGPKSLALYAGYQAARRTGWLRRSTPIYDWDERPLGTWLHSDIPAKPESYLDYWSKKTPRFFFKPNVTFKNALQSVLQENQSAAIAMAEEILQGRFCIFGADPVELGFPPDWAAFAPIAGGENAPPVDLSRHWASYTLESLPSDVKLLWEAGRFGWVYPLARAFQLTGNQRYSEGFWTLVNSWRAANHPNAGLHWFTGQGAALRLMALVFAMYAFSPAFSEAPRRMANLAQMIAIHADRIPPTISYARAQGNNHLLTEAVGLYTAGLLFPEFRRAAYWKKLGRRWLIAGFERQVFSDGGYMQHSTNYHRLALHAGLWAARLAEVNGEPLSGSVLDALRRMSRCLSALIDPETGCVPNFGPNDGANILPLTTCPFNDYRPVIQASAISLSGHPAFPSGPWNEACVWLGFNPVSAVPLNIGEKPQHSDTVSAAEGPARSGQSSQSKDERPLSETDNKAPGIKDDKSLFLNEGLNFPQAGIYLMRGKRSWGMLRCARFTSRPGHSDQLHFDLWRHGYNVAHDAGTYLYNGTPPWDNGLAGAMAHNTVVIDDQDPMRRAGRFLWLDWAQGHMLGRWRSQEGHLEVLTAKHNGYRRLGVTHQRTVIRAGDDLWAVIDDLLGSGIHRAVLNWSLPDWPWQLQQQAISLDTPEGNLKVNIIAPKARLGVYRAGRLSAGEKIEGPSSICGWQSPTYTVLTSSPLLLAEVNQELPLRFITWWCFNGASSESLSIGWREPGYGLAPAAWLTFEEEHLQIDAHPADSSGLCPSAGRGRNATL